MKRASRILGVLSLLAGAGLMGGLGLLYLLDPAAIRETASVSPETASALTEIRSTYGGLHVGIALFLLVCAASVARRRTGLLFCGFAFAGAGIARVAGILEFRGTEPSQSVTAVLEITFGAVGLWLSRVGLPETVPSRADAYWQQYLASQPAGEDRPARYLEAFRFGFTPEDATEIADLVLRGVKTATGSVLWSYEADGKPIPRHGDHSIVIDGEGKPVCVIRTTDVSILPFDEVPELYAQEGGEADRTLATWRPMYWRYIVSECRRIGREPDEKAPLVMERFRVVYREAPDR